MKSFLRTATLAATVLVVTTVTGGCGNDDPDPAAPDRTPTSTGDGGAADSRAQLERSRGQVRDAFDELGDAVATRLEGRISRDRSSRYDGCETSGTDEFSSFRYQVRAGVEANQYLVELPYLEKLRPDLASAGFDPGPPGPLGSSSTIRTMTGGRDDLEVSVVENPDRRLVVLTVTGPCLPTDPRDTDHWISAD